MKIGHSFLRVSSQEQIKGYGIERQIAERDRVCQERGITLVETYGSADRAVSARKGRQRTHGDLKRFFDDLGTKIKPGEFFLVENLDRLSREDPLDAWRHFDRIIARGIIVITTTNNREYSATLIKQQPWLMHELLGEMQRAHMENEHRSTRISDAWARKRKEAVTLGKKASAIVPAWLEAVRSEKGEITHFNRIDDRVAVVKEIFEFAANGMGAWSIAKVLNERNVPTFGNGKLWRSAIISKIITSKAVLGIYVPKKLVDGRWEPQDQIDGYFGEPIIDPVIFARANTLREGRDQTGAARQRRGKAIVNLFNERCFCDACGGTMRYKSYSGKSAKGEPRPKRNYLFCESNMVGHGCNYVRKVRYDWFEETILNHINVFPLDELFTDHSSNEEMTAIDAKIGTVTLKLNKLERNVTRAKEFMKDAETMEEVHLWRRDLADTLSDMKPVQAELAALHRTKSDLAFALSSRSEARDTLERLKVALDGEDIGDRFIIRQKLSILLKTFIDQIRFDQEFVTVILRGGLINYRFSLGKFGGAPKKNPMKLLGCVDLRPQLGDRATGGISPQVFTTNPLTGKHDEQLQSTFDKLVRAKA